MIRHPILKSVVTLVAFFVSTSAIAGGDVDAGKEKAAACVACHGPDGKSILGAYPNLGGQYADYIVAALKQYKSGERSNPIMAGFVLNLSVRDMKDIGAFYASQKGLGTLPKN